MDFARVHGWLADTYWSPGIPQPLIERGFAHSALTAGAYRGDEQVGCLRVVSDLTRFAYVADVFVDTAHRGHGLARAMVRFALDHPDLAMVYQWFLGTADAHGVYQEGRIRRAAKSRSLHVAAPSQAMVTALRSPARAVTHAYRVAISR